MPLDPSDPPARETAVPVRRRDRHGRGPQAPAWVPPRGIRNPRPSRGARFDRIVLGVVSEIDRPWREHLGELEYAVEDLPLLPDDWDEAVPLAALVPAGSGHPQRIVLFRRPLERRCESRFDLEYLVRNVIARQLAEVLGVGPDVIDPDFDGDL